MSKTKVKIQLMRSVPFADDHTIYVSSSLIRKYHIPTNQPLNLRFGAFRSSVRVVPAGKTERLRIGASLASQMGVAAGVPLRIAYQPSSQTIALGPVLGVLVSRVYANQPDRPFGDITSWCREVVEASRLQGVSVYFFSPSGIGDPGNGTIEGWTYDKGWRKGVFPVPDTIHNRLTSRKLENQSSVQQLFQESKKKYGTVVFNEKYLDKTEVFAALKQEPSLRRYLPESHSYTGFEQLKTMSSKYRILFLKPVRGSLGKGIIRLTKTESGAYACHFSELNGTRKAVYPSLAKVYAAIAPRLKTQKFQIQQGLNIATVGGRPLDFRALAQKGLSGEWEITSIVGRIAGPKHFVSNLAKGGTVTRVKEAVSRSNIPASKRLSTLAELKKSALQIAKGVEQTINAHFGELGVDLAADQSGRVWLLEVNSKPSKNDNTQLTEGKIRPSVKMLLQYTRRLAQL